MSEMIGNVRLDDRDYPGRDLYTDGKVEDDLLEIARETDRKDFDRIVGERRSWPVMYHFSTVRQNILSWYPVKPGDHVLEIGSGCGAVTAALAKKAEKVTCVELSKKRSLVNAWRNREYSNIEILLGNFQDVEKRLGEYDLVTLIGVFEYGQGYIDSKTPYVDFLGIIGRHLKKDGKILIAIENRLGMKYFAGCTEDHSGRFFDGIEGYPGKAGARTFSKRELEKIFEEAGFRGRRFFYPYPDYKFPMSVYSDAYLPRKGELRSNMVNFDRKRMLLFDETKAYDALMREEFPIFSNSFFVILSEEAGDSEQPETSARQDRGEAPEQPETSGQKGGQEPPCSRVPDYIRFSNDRAAAFSIRTEIETRGAGLVRKSAVSDEGRQHILDMEKSMQLLEDVFRGTRFVPNRCTIRNGTAEFEFLEGNTLEEEADRLLGDEEALCAFFKSFFDELDKTASCGFAKTEKFIEVFGGELPESYQQASGSPAAAGFRAAQASDIDLVLNNIIVKDGKWNVIDYEWTFDFPVPIDFLKMRVIHYYTRGNSARNAVDENALYDCAGIRLPDSPAFLRMEEHFQNYIAGDAAPLWKLYPEISPGIVSPGGDAGMEISSGMKTALLYFDRGSGFSEGDTLRIPEKDGIFEAEIMTEGAACIRLDPSENASAAVLEPVYADGRRLDESQFGTNGFTADHRTYIFEKEDPQILIPLPAGSTGVFLKFRVYTDQASVRVQTEEVLRKKDEQLKLLEERLDGAVLTLDHVEHAVEAVKGTKTIRLYRSLRDGFRKSDPFAGIRPALENGKDVHLMLDRRSYQPEGIVLSGWFYDPAYRGEDLKVTDAAGAGLDVKMERIRRADVEAELGITDGRFTGFNILISYDQPGNTPLYIRAENPRGILTLPLDIEPDYQKRIEKRKLVTEGKSGDLLPAEAEYDEWAIDRRIAEDRPDAGGPAKAEPGTEKQMRADAALISIVIPLFETPEGYLLELLDSLTAQTLQNIEICLADGSRDDRLEKVIKEHYPGETRIRYRHLEKNLGISGNTNAAMEMAEGEILMLCDHDDIVDPDACRLIAEAFDEGTDIVYTDEDKVTYAGHFLYDPHFKPDYNPDLLRSNNYICHIFAVRRSLVEKTGLMRPEFDGAQDYDFILRCCEKARGIRHIPKALYHWRAHPASTAGNPDSKRYAWESGRRALEAHFGRLGISAEVMHTEHPGHYRVKYAVKGEPKVSILIPNRDQEPILRRCVNSVLDRSTWGNFEILILENGSSSPAVFEFYREISAGDSRVRVLRYDQEFNFAAINNWGVSHASGGYLIFLNNDTEVIAGDWIEELLGLCQREDTGCVGAYLEYPDHTIQHTGVIVGMGGAAGHMFGGMDVNLYPGGGRCFSTQDLSAVTGACMMTKRSVFDAAGGFDEAFKISYNDIDYCLKLRDMGLLVAVNVYAQLMHYESKTRGSDDEAISRKKHERLMSEADLLQRKWPRYFENGDPYYNPNLTLERPDFSLRGIVTGRPPA